MIRAGLAGTELALCPAHRPPRVSWIQAWLLAHHRALLGSGLLQFLPCCPQTVWDPISIPAALQIKPEPLNQHLEPHHQASAKSSPAPVPLPAGTQLLCAEAPWHLLWPLPRTPATSVPTSGDHSPYMAWSQKLCSCHAPSHQVPPPHLVTKSPGQHSLSPTAPTLATN